MSLRQRIAARLPSGLKTMAVDSAWTMGFEVALLVSVTFSFVLLGSQLGAEGYGEYVGLFAITTPLSAVGSAAMLAAMQYMFQEEKPVQQVMSTFLSLTLYGGGLGVIGATVLAELTLTSLSATAIVAMAVSEIIVFPMGRVISAGVRALHGVPASVRVELAFVGARFMLLIGVFLLSDLTIMRVSIGWLAVNSVVLAWLFVVVLARDNVRPKLVPVRARDLRVGAALGSPIFISDFQTNGDKIVLGAYSYKEDLGLYGAAFRIASMAMVPLRAMDIAVFHRFLQSDKTAIGQHTRRARQYSVASLLVITPIAAALWLLAPQLDLVLGDEFSGSVTMMRWLVLWLPFRAVSGAPINGMLGLGRLGLRLLVLVIGAASAMGMYLIFIPDMGWEGAVIGTVLGEAVLLVAAWVALIWAQRQHDQGVEADQPVTGLDGNGQAADPPVVPTAP